MDTEGDVGSGFRLESMVVVDVDIRVEEGIGDLKSSSGMCCAEKVVMTLQ